MRYIVLALFTTTLAGCPGNTGDTDADSTDTSASEANTTTISDMSTTAEDTLVLVTTTGEPTSSADTDNTIGEPTTTGAPNVDCGEPAMECDVTNREWCADLGDLCGKTPLSPAAGGNGTDYCALVDMMCIDTVPSCQLCNYIGNTCKQLGGGASDCDEVTSECLCRALAHDLDA